MKQNLHLETFGRGVFNILAQSETVTQSNKFTIVSGSGADIGIKSKMSEWAKRKTITQSLMLACVKIAENKNELKRAKQYWNTYHCMNEVVSVDGRIYGKYCKNRFCKLCEPIRRAKEINLYYPVLKTWNKPYFVTLTIRSIRKINLSKFMKGMVRAFQLIKNKYRKQNQRGTGAELLGIRSLECNFNPEKNTYNPHFHIIVQNEEMAELLVSEWLKLWTSKWAGPQSQKILPITNIEVGLIQVIKYGTKIFTDIEPSTSKKKGVRTHKIYVSAFDNINAAMNGLRLFERFGFNLPKERTLKDAKYTAVFQFEKWKFEIAHTDWFSEDIEAGLSGFIIQSLLRHQLNDSMDCNSE